MTAAAPAAAPAHEAGLGTVYLPKGREWGRAIAAAGRDAIAERILQLPAWADGRLEAANLDVKQLQGGGGARGGGRVQDRRIDG